MGISADLKTIHYLEYVIKACESIKNHQFKTNLLVVYRQFREAPSLCPSIWVVVSVLFWSEHVTLVVM